VPREYEADLGLRGEDASVRELGPWDILGRGVHDIRTILENVAAQNEPTDPRIVPRRPPYCGEDALGEHEADTDCVIVLG
jgi:hypothetical protein